MTVSYTSTKPTIYLIDGLNLVRSFLARFGATEDNITSEFLDDLANISASPRYCMNEYHVIFDGGYRSVGPLYRNGVHISFSEEYSADELIYQQADYLHQSGQRVIVVTSDRELQDSIRELGVKTLFCQKFYASLRIDEK